MLTCMQGHEEAVAFAKDLVANRDGGHERVQQHCIRKISVKGMTTK